MQRSRRIEPVLIAGATLTATLLFTGCADTEGNVGRFDRGDEPRGSLPGPARGGASGNDSPLGPISNPGGMVTVVPMGNAGGSAPQSNPSPVTNTKPKVTIDQLVPNPAGLSEADVKKLMAGGPPGKMRWLYPYDGTVFPQGMLAPVVMWEGQIPDAVYLRISSRAFEYRGVLKPGVQLGVHSPLGTSGLVGALLGQSQQPQLQFPQEVWNTAGQQTVGRGDVFTLELTVRVNGVVSGPLVSHITIAEGAVKGSIYYNVNLSELGASSGVNDLIGNLSNFDNSLSNIIAGEKVIRIRPGGTAELITPMSTCNGCHAVSANGARVLTQASSNGALGSDVNTQKGLIYELGDKGIVNPMGTPVGASASFGALYPDGSKYLAQATNYMGDVGQSKLYQTLFAPLVSAALYDTANGAAVPDTGIVPSALMPMFSPDGSKLVFNDFAIDDARGLAVMDYDTRNHKASAYRMLMREEQGSALKPAWPFFLPDNRAVIFARTSSPDFSGAGASFDTKSADFATNRQVPPSAAPNSDLFVADVASGKVTILAKAMGYHTPEDALQGRTYLPFGMNDVHHNYLPTVSPVAAGGYFWVFFDTLRSFGNLGLMRQLWGAAIDISPDGTYTSDPSHPAFYLPGQQFGENNHRAFAARDLCKPNSQPCATAIDCCEGICAVPPGAMSTGIEQIGTCAPPPPNQCAQRDEHCTADADCCPVKPGEVGYSCIAGFCAYIELW